MQAPASFHAAVQAQEPWAAVPAGARAALLRRFADGLMELKASGFGRECSHYAMDEYLEVKYVS